MSVEELSITPVQVRRVLNAYHREVLTVHREDRLVFVSQQFERKRTAVAMVLDDDESLVGIVSLGDIVHAIGEHGAGAVYLPVRMIMSYDPVTCAPPDTAKSAIEQMTEFGVKHLPVVENGKLLGCIEKIDALETLHSEAELDFNELRNYIFKTGGRY
jgi:CBS domain-containing protein